MQNAFKEFLNEFVDFKTLSEKLLPVAERMLLRSPEIALDCESSFNLGSLAVTTDLLNSTKHDISALLPAKLLPAVLSASKSSNADTRSKSVKLFRAIISHTSDASVQSKISTEVLALPKTGKSASAEHRMSLFSMSKSLPVSDVLSVQVIDTLVPLIAKENNEPALVVLCDNFEVHLAHILASQSSLSAGTATALAKELNSAKVSTRRALSTGVAGAIWQVSHSDAVFSAEGEKLVSALASAFETNLNTAAANPASTPAGFLEGYTAAALALGPLVNVKGAEKLSKSASLASLLVVSPKPSFVLNDKAYSKLPSDIDRVWLLRCLETIVLSQSDRLSAYATRCVLPSVSDRRS